MGLFNKLKNALFEEEEIELPVRQTTEEKKVAPIVKEPPIERTVEAKKDVEKVLEENDRDLFKVENTFKFPEFDEEEFKTIKEEPKKSMAPEKVITPKESYERPKDTFSYERKVKPVRKELKKDAPIEAPKKTFRPSPVISPVYGVLDKNYKKEDIITVKEEKTKRKYDVDEIRKKAFGSLEDEIEKSFETPKEEFFDTTSTSIDELLDSTVDEQIDMEREKTPVEIAPIKEEVTTRSKRKSQEVEDEISKNTYEENEELEVLDKREEKNERKELEEDTLENDLFDLIDSMYDDREEDE